MANMEEQTRLLKEAYERKKKEDAQIDAEPSYEGFTSEDKLVMGMGYTICRVLSLPKTCGSSFIKCDDGRLRLFKFPHDGNSVILRAVTRVMERKYVGRDSSNKSIWKFPVKETNPDVYQMVYNNESITEGSYGANGWGKWKKGANGWGGYPSTTTCFVNVINRREFTVKMEKKDANGNDIEEEKTYPADWCVKNNHSLLLSKSVKSFGAAVTVYDLLMDAMFPNFGAFFDYDLAIFRLKEDPWYQMYKADTLVNNTDVFPFVKQGKLTEAEQNVVQYNLDEITAPSTNAFIYQNLKGKLEIIDKALNTHYLDDLERAVEAEGGQKATAAPATTPVSTGGIAESKGESRFTDASPPAATAKPATRTRTAPSTAAPAAAPAGDIWATIRGFAAKAPDGSSLVDKLSDDKKKLISGVNGTEIIFTVPEDSQSCCPKCGKAQPVVIDDNCLYCGLKF